MKINYLKAAGAAVSLLIASGPTLASVLWSRVSSGTGLAWRGVSSRSRASGVVVLLTVLAVSLPAGATRHTAGMSFATGQEALNWVARRASQLGLEGLSTKEDSEGRIIGISGISIGSPGDVAEKHAQLMREIGGSEHAVRIAGKRFSLQSEAKSTFGTTARALCSGDLCTSHESFRNNYLVYREIGSRTNVTSGGFEFRRQTIQGLATVDCIDPPGPIPMICRNTCIYSQGCPVGLTQESGQPHPVCTKTCSGNVRNVTLTLTAQAYEWVGSVLVPSFGTTKTTHDPSLEVRFWEWVVPGTDTAISNAAGLCGTHRTTGPGGAVVSGKSKVGTVPSSCL